MLSAYGYPGIPLRTAPAATLLVSLGDGLGEVSATAIKGSRTILASKEKGAVRSAVGSVSPSHASEADAEVAATLAFKDFSFACLGVQAPNPRVPNGRTIPKNCTA